jgi:hypothetical protein
MPKPIEVPGLGVIDFPDEMSDDDISKTIRHKLIPEAHQAKMKAQNPPEPGLVDKAVEGVKAVGRGFKNSFLPTDRWSDVVDGPVHAVKHPIESAKLIGGALQDASHDQFVKMFEAADRIEDPKQSGFQRAGNVLETLGRGAAGVLPAIGPSAAQAGEKIGQGDLEGVGEAAGMLVEPAAVLKGGKALAGKAGMMKKAATVADELPAAAPRPEIPAVRRFKVLSPKVQEKLTAAVESSLFGTGPFSRFREKQAKAISAYADSVVDEVSKIQGSPEEVGQNVITAIEEAKTAAKEEAASSYRQIDDEVGNIDVEEVEFVRNPDPTSFAKGGFQKVKKSRPRVQVETKELKAVAAGMLERIQKEKELVPASELNRTQQILQTIVDSPNKVSFTTVHDARSSLLAIARSLDAAIPGKAGGAAKKLASVARESMMAAAREHSPELAKKVEAADAQWRGLTEDFNDTVLARIAKEAPEKAHHLFKTASSEDIKAVKRRLSATSVAQLQARVLRDALDAAMKTDKATTAVPGGQVGPVVVGSAATEPRLNAGAFANELKKLDAKSGKLGAIFDPQQLKAIQDLARATTDAGTPTSSWLGNTLSVTILGLTGRAVMKGDVMGALGGATSMTAINVLARVMTKPGGASKLTKYLDAMAKKDKVGAQYWGKQLAISMQKEAAEEQKRPLYPSAEATPTN